MTAIQDEHEAATQDNHETAFDRTTLRGPQLKGRQLVEDSYDRVDQAGAAKNLLKWRTVSRTSMPEKTGKKPGPDYNDNLGSLNCRGTGA